MWWFPYEALHKQTSRRWAVTSDQLLILVTGAEKTSTKETSMHPQFLSPHSSLLEDIYGMSNSFNNRFPGHTQENTGERRWGGIKWRIEESPFLPSPPYNPSFPPYFLLSFIEFSATVQKLFGIDQAASQFNNPCFHESSINARTTLICWGFVRFRGNKIHVGTF